MNYKEFLQYIQKKVQERLGENTRVELHHIQKNNAISRDGLLILEEGRSLSPTIYLNTYYDAYRLGMSVPEILADILAGYKNNRVPEGKETDFYKDFSNVSGRIICKLIHFEKNREFLKRVPYFSYLDLAAVCCYLLEDETIGKGTIQIYRSHLELWEITEEELFECARENTARLLPWCFQSMEELFGEHQEEMILRDSTDFFPMYILSNKLKMFGATCILYDHILESVGEKLGESFYILPSSVHECIIVPDTIPFTREMLRNMVREINETQVLPEEVLSGEVYHYDRLLHRLSV